MSPATSAFRSTPPAGAFATTSCGSRSSRPGSRTQRSPSSRSTARSARPALRPLRPEAAFAAVALDPQAAELVDEAGIGNARCLPQLGVDTRLREPGHRVELVEDDRVAVDKEVNTCKAAAASALEGLQGELTHAIPGGLADARRHDQLHPAGLVLRGIVVPLGVEHDLPG